jgi:hypothetical protein
MQLPALHLTKAKVNTDLLRNYLYQALNDGFGFSYALESVLKAEQIPTLSDRQVRSYVKKYIGEVPSWFYFFEHEHLYRDGDTPCLYTNIVSSSFDNEGLLVLERFNNQIFDLRSFQGAYIDSSCHDLDLSIEGRYMMRSSENRPGFFEYHLNKKGNYFHYNLYGDIDQFVTNFLNIHQRDRIELAFGRGILVGIENFEAPQNRAEVKALLKANCNYPSSPLLRDFFYADKELAILAIQQEPLVFTLLSPELQQEHQILKVLCLQTESHLTPYFLSYKIDPYTFLDEQQMIQLIIEQRLNFHAFSSCEEPSKAILEASAQHDSRFLAYLEKFKNHSTTPSAEPNYEDGLPFDNVLSIQEIEDAEDESILFSEPDPLESERNHAYFHDPHLMLQIAKKEDLILRKAPMSLQEDEKWVEAVLISNLNALQYSSPTIKNNAALLMRVVLNPATYQELRIYHAHEDRTLQRFSDLFLQPDFKLILLEQLPPQPLNEDFPF